VKFYMERTDRSGRTMTQIDNTSQRNNICQTRTSRKRCKGNAQSRQRRVDERITAHGLAEYGLTTRYTEAEYTYRTPSSWSARKGLPRDSGCQTRGSGINEV